MCSTIQRPRRDVSEHAPRLITVKIDPEKIGLLIGPGGKTIRGIQETTGAVIEVEDDGVVTIASSNGAWAVAAQEKVEALTASVQIGKIYKGRVTSIKDFGAFVEILPGRDGLVHISELSTGYISNIDKVVNVGDPMKVLVIDVDEHDRVKLSRRRALEELGLEDELAGEEGGDDDGERGEGGDDEDRPRRRRTRRGGGRGGNGGGGGGGRGREGAGRYRD